MRAEAPAEPVPAEAAGSAEVAAPCLLVAPEVAEPAPAPEPSPEAAPPDPTAEAALPPLTAAPEATEAAPAATEAAPAATGAVSEATEAAPPAPQGMGAAQQAAMMLAAGVKVPAQGRRYTWAHGGHLSAYFSPRHTLPQYTPDANEPHCCYREVARLPQPSP